MYPLILDYLYYKKTLLQLYKLENNSFNEKFFMENCKISICLKNKRSYVPIGSSKMGGKPGNLIFNFLFLNLNLFFFIIRFARFNKI
jgi:hypothetical protein